MPAHQQPAKLHEAKGNYRPSRHADRDEGVDVEYKAPDKPEYLTEAEGDVWEWLIKQISKWGILTTADEVGLVGICKLHTKMKFKSDDMTASDFGQLRGYLSEYGLTPSSRAKLRSNGKKDESNPFADLDD